MKQTGGFTGFMDSGALGSIGGAFTGVANLVGAINSISASKKASKQAQEALDLQKNQLAIENARYDKRENERINANKAIDESAAAFNQKADLPTAQI